MTLTEQVAKNIIRKLLKGEDYRIEIVTLINAEFLQFAIEFFKEVVFAKFNDQTVTADWYKRKFLDHELPTKDIAINSGLNMKTIDNMYNSVARQVVIDASNNHYDTLYKSIKSLVDSGEELELTLTLKFRDVSVDLNVSETLIVINTLAVKRAALRGGLWSTAGKRVEKPLMQTLCKLYRVPEENYTSDLQEIDGQEGFTREIDFYLIKDGENYKCEVKLMGKGNPESADSAFARKSKVFIADTLSETNKMQLDSEKIEWVELRDVQGFQRFKTVLENLGIPFTDIDIGNLERDVERIFNEIFVARLL
ncbi:MAG: CfrBI family restriction endonuclease [Gemmatimonadetes bacterium]|nr:CfrBI family restriction endonuclease [Gemmatimonadota bacterium]MYK44126.1 CfrBI family restriction endonuclease [Gammaproteobacteria bacterium]